jgi:maltokinase
VTETVTGAVLRDMLARWLPRQRWFPGGGAAIGELSVISDVTLVAGDPQLRHLVIEAGLARGPARFQVLLGCRRELPEAAGQAVIGTVRGLAVYDALHDPELAAVLVAGIAGQRQEGALRFVREEACPAELGPSRLLTAEQSNTSLVFGETAILKVLRRLFPGANPDLEVADALARLGSVRVAAPFGWIETQIDGEPVLLAVLSQYLANARDGWTMAGESLGQLYAGLQAPVAGTTPSGVSAGTGLPFAAEARELGVATAQMHGDMATAFGSREINPAELGALASTLVAKLDEAVAVIPELGEHAARIRSAYDDLAAVGGPVMIQRIHGDYHLGQVLLSQHGWVALDFEGEPAAPLAERRALAPALRDVAGMLRSFDYAARHQLVGQPDRRDLAAAAATWVRQCQDAFCAGYSEVSGAEPGEQATLLRALMLEKAVYEVIYEYRHRPSWLSIPLDYVAAA